MLKDDLEIINVDSYINPEYCFKMVILGDSGVGKTSLVKYEINNSFINNNESTIFFQHSFKNFSILEKIVRLQIWDICGQGADQSSMKHFCRSTLLIAVVFSLESLDSFYNVNKWLNLIKGANISESPILVLIGNKCDINDQKIIPECLIDDFCRKNGIEKYFEASAKTGQNVHEIFKKLIKELFIKYAMPIININNENKNEEKEILPPIKNSLNSKISKCFNFCYCYNQ